jgi:hypothetical protein
MDDISGMCCSSCFASGCRCRCASNVAKNSGTFDRRNDSDDPDNQENFSRRHSVSSFLGLPAADISVPVERSIPSPNGLTLTGADRIA